jgi:hypothetical protein
VLTPFMNLSLLPRAVCSTARTCTPQTTSAARATDRLYINQQRDILERAVDRPRILVPNTPVDALMSYVQTLRTHVARNRQPVMRQL